MSARAVCIGGGITGVLTARELCLAGFDVTVLEGKHVGAGSSSRTAAGIRQQFSTPGTVRGMRYAVAFYQAFQAETEESTSPIVQNGYLFLHDKPESWAIAKKNVQMQQECGLREVEALESPELQRRFPWVAEHLLGGTFCPTDGFLLPHLIYNDGARRVRELGGNLLQNAPVTGAQRQGQRLQAVITPKGTFEADLFVDCTNIWSRRTARVLGAEELPVDPLKRYLWFLAREGSLGPEELQQMPLVIGPTGVYCRPEHEGSLLMGRAHEAEPEPDFTYEDQDHVEGRFSHQGGVEAEPYTAWAELAEALPAVGEFAGFSATTSGYYGTTPDHNPFLGYDRQLTNLIRLVGFSGHGAMFGPFTALVARELAQAGHDLPAITVDGASVSLETFRIGREFAHRETMVI
jgi:sarcosine oxidase subunit beta